MKKRDIEREIRAEANKKGDVSEIFSYFSSTYIILQNYFICHIYLIYTNMRYLHQIIHALSVEHKGKQDKSI